MTTVQASCPSCGVVRLNSDRVALTHDHQTYVFRCPLCRIGVTKRADRNIVKLLQAAGVVTLGVGYGEMPEVVTAPVAPIITNDDVLDFHLNIDAELDGLLGYGPVS